MVKYVTPKEAAKQLGVHFRTLSRWEKEGKIQAIKTPSGQRRYDVQSYTAKSGSVRSTVIYARVSSRAQQADLNRQIAAISHLYPDAEIVSEVGGGLNFKRKRLLALLERVMQGTVGRIVVAHKDRLARFGFDFYEWFCSQYGCSILVLNETNLSPETEMVEDILAILHCFSSRLSGLRKYKTQLKEDPSLPRFKSEKGME
ncbi:IS607 family transposase [Aerosakkonema sp. BLCC-F183]|uniref:IS607 family transposase n=1 Tax=Aerosakkonema sp. BLCC-F183 TaxID=3342834 RepID=UPI0035B73401